MEKLLEVLNQINSGEIKVTAEVHDGMNFIRSTVNAEISLDDIESLAQDFLIAEGGRVNYSNCSVLRQAGFSVFPVEKDSFGWLIGGITTDKGILTFG